MASRESCKRKERDRLILYNANSSTPGVRYEEAVEDAICFGWIDSRANKRDGESHFQLFSKRNPRSKWSRQNRERAERMIKEGLMQEAGMKMIEMAKESGTWTASDSVLPNEIPPDLRRALDDNLPAPRNFNGFPRSSKRIIPEWIQNAKKPETRQKRIIETVRLR